MDIFELIQSVNFIAIIAFFVTTGGVGYEVYLLMKQKKQSTTPNVPDFNKTKTYGELRANSLVMSNKPEDDAIFKKPNSKVLIGLMVTMIFFGVISFIGLFVKNENSDQEFYKNNNQVVTNMIASDGIKIYSKDWTELNDLLLKKAKIGDLLYVGILSIPKTDIDGARIKINQENWDEKSKEVLYNEKKRLFYKKYIVASGESKLKIEAQLHSKKNGWLIDNNQYEEK